MTSTLCLTKENTETQRSCASQAAQLLDGGARVGAHAGLQSPVHGSQDHKPHKGSATSSPLYPQGRPQ